MAVAIPPVEDDIPGGRKRKWSPLREDSEDESLTGRSATEAREDSATPGTLLESDTELPHKRPRLQDATDPKDAARQSGSLGKAEPRTAQLPLEIWQRICSFLEPVSLGRLICVDRTLNTLLDSRKPVPEYMRVKNVTQNDIWSYSRKSLLPGFPRPLSWISELDMWKLLLGISCQFCGKKSTTITSTTPSPWTAGPGQEGIRIVWPFAVRSCGKCLTSRMIKDANVRFSDDSILLAGLPYAYLTPDLHFVTSIALRAGSPPIGLDLTRYYSQPQLEQLKQDMDHASSLGQAAAEEWVKGLEEVGREKTEDARRFELWEATGQLQALHQSRVMKSASLKYNLPAKPALPALSAPSVPTHAQNQSNSAGSRTQSPLSAQYGPSSTGVTRPSGFNTPYLPLKHTSPAPGQIIPDLPKNGSAVNLSHGLYGRPERSGCDVDLKLVERRTEIESRCLQLDPPIKSSTLPYMQAFSDAMKIHMPLNDRGWDVLKPRLVAQHEAALKKEEEFLAVNKNFLPHAGQGRENEEQLKQAQALIERRRDAAQRPVREKLAAYIDDIIQSQWDGGSFVTKDNAPQFAADLLIYVRRRFFETLDENDKELVALGPHTSTILREGTTDRHLTLEDMKWVYETKIRPITQQYSKEIFLCGACDIDRKHYALDAVIQHYAAKHTHAFSHGSATVYWKAEWPLEPPFDPRPTRSPPSRPVDHNGVSPIYQRDFSIPQHFDPGSAFADQTHSTRAGIAMTPDLVPHSLTRHAPRAYSVDEELYQRRPYYVPLQSSNPGPPIYGNEAAYETYYLPVSPAFSTRGPVAVPYRKYPAEADQLPYPVRRSNSSAMSPTGTNGYASRPPRFHGARIEHQSLLQPGQPSGLQQIQMAELARNAREIWDETDGIEDLPDSVRTHVIIHHVVLRFRHKYTNEPTLALFAEALLNNSRLKPLADLSNLVCKTCTVQGNDVASSEHRESQYKLPELLKHFQTSHMETTIPPPAAHTALEMPRPDWKFDMLQLPDKHTIQNLIHSPGTTDTKLGLIAAVLPKCFQDPPPKLDPAAALLRASDLMPPADETIRAITQSTSPSNIRSDVHDYIPLDEYTNNIEQLPGSSNLDRQGDGLGVENGARDDEYDPHRPAPSQQEPIRNYRLQQTGSRHRGPMRSPGTYDDDTSPGLYMVDPGTRGRLYDNSSRDLRLQSEYVSRRRHHSQEEGNRLLPYTLASSHDGGRPTREPERGFEDDRDDERVRSPREQVKLEAVRSPARTSISGTAQFLNQFDLDHNSFNRRGSPDEESMRDQSSSKSARPVQGSRHPRDRLDSHERPGTAMASRKATPRKAMSRGGISARSRSPSVLRPGNLRNAEAQPYLRHAANVAFSHEPAQQAQYSDPRYLERPMYEDELVPQRYVPISSYRSRSPGLSQQGMQLRYVEAPPLRPYRYADEGFYEQPGREYVQIMPHDRGQYTERPFMPDHVLQYIDDDEVYGPNPNDHERQAYHGPPPPRREVTYDPYDSRGRY